MAAGLVTDLVEIAAPFMTSQRDYFGKSDVNKAKLL